MEFARELAKRIGLQIELMETGDLVYTISTPTDVQYDPSDEKTMTEYLSLSKDIKIIKTTFQLVQ